MFRQMCDQRRLQHDRVRRSRKPLWLPCRFHFERVIKALEVVEDSGHGGDLNDLTFVEVAPDFGEQFSGDGAGIEC